MTKTNSLEQVWCENFFKALGYVPDVKTTFTFERVIDKLVSLGGSTLFKGQIIRTEQEVEFAIKTLKKSALKKEVSASIV